LILRNFYNLLQTKTFISTIQKNGEKRHIIIECSGTVKAEEQITQNSTIKVAQEAITIKVAHETKKVETQIIRP
jgi:hypothetical protein